MLCRDSLNLSVVAILNANNEIVGTGFLVSEIGHIVTCAHVVTDAGAEPDHSVSVRFLVDQTVAKAHVDPRCWLEKDDGDLAVLKLSDGVPKGAVVLRVGSSTGIEDVELFAYGFPQNADQGLLAGARVMGKPGAPGEGVRGLQLRSQEISPGYSGGPLLHERAGRVVAIIRAIRTTDLPTGRQSETALAIPVERLGAVIANACVQAAGDEQLRALLERVKEGLSPKQDGVDILFKFMRVELSTPDCERLRTLLARELNVDNQDPEVLSTKLIGLPPVKFVALANRLTDEIIDGSQKDPSSNELAETLERIVELGLAARLGAAKICQLAVANRAAPGMGIVALPCRDIVLADYYNAGLDGRRPEFCEIPPDDRHGGDQLWADLRQYSPSLVWPTLCVPKTPAIGFNENHSPWVESVLRHLAEALGIPEIWRTMDTTDKLARQVNAKLEALASPDLQTVPKRWYLVYLRQGQQTDRAVDELKRLLPKLRVCGLNEPDAIEEEAELTLVLGQFFERKRKRASRR